MKHFITLVLLLISTSVVAQDYVTEKEFDVVVTGTNAFGENHRIIVIEVWAEFNKANAFKDWKNLEGAKYYRLDLSKAPSIKKRFRIRMVPTIIVFLDGSKELEYKAGLDLICPVTLAELNKDIEDLSTASQY
tara:strand:- start:840 stop:1238 length:399 start_codon:yes stop_codon:yes gene_type:complete